MIKKIVLAFVMVMALAGISWPYSGTGTSTDPFIIDTYADFRTLMQSNYATSGSYFKLSCDIQMSGYSNWEPIGTLDTPFTGHFDGQGHIIYVNIQPLPVTLGTYVKLTYDRSLFGVAGSGSEIQSLDVEGTVRGYNAGGLVSVMQGGTIKNCSFSGDVIVETSPAGDDAMNYLIDELGDDNITDANDVEILDDAVTKTRVYGKINAGGLVAVMTGGSIEDSTFRGNVTASADETPACAGGIVGRMIEDSASIYGCRVEGDAVITASTAANGYGVLASAGGIAGYANTQLDSKIESCTFDGVVNSTYYAGGITGAVHGTILSGDVVTSTARITGTYSAGGIAGYMASGAWATSNTVESGAVITAEVYSAGGIVGILETNGRTGGNKPVENNSSGATLSGEVYTGSIIGALGNNTYSGAVIDESNTYTGTEDYPVIGRDEWGQPSDGGRESFSISTTALTGAVVGEYYTAYLSLDKTPSNDRTVTWTFSGTLPEGLMSNDQGVIFGTPATAETRTFTAGAFIAGYGPTPSADITITVIYVEAPDTSGSIDITTNSILPPGTQGMEYSYALEAEGQFSADTSIWYVDSGDLPAGLTLSRNTGVIYGTPTASGNFTFRVRLLAGEAITAKTFTLTITAGIIITDESLPDGKEGQEYSYTLTVSGDSSVVWWVSDGFLPYGLSLADDDGTISGIPQQYGEYTFTVQAYSDEKSCSKTFTITINHAFSILTDAVLPKAKVGVWYSLTLSADADDSNLVAWRVIDSSLPDGLYLNLETGNISGTPQTEGIYSFFVQATAGGFITVKQFTLIVGSVLEILTETPLQTGKVGEYYYCSFEVDSGYPAYWTLSDGDIPSGLIFSDGALSGTPTETGTYTFTLGAEAGGLTASKTFTITISPALSITTDSTLPAARAGMYYYQRLDTDAENYDSIYWSAVDLPSGLSISSFTGELFGTISTEGAYTFTVSAVIGGVSATKTFTLIVTPSLSITTENILPDATINEMYSVALLTDASEDQTVTWVAWDSLPEGLTLDPQTGILSGYVLNEGTYTFTIQAFSNGLTTAKFFTLTAGENLSIITTQVTSLLKAGEYFSLPLMTDKYNTANTSWDVINGILPPGLNLDSDTGIISGSPTRAGTYTFTVQAASGYSVAQKQFTLTIGFMITGDTYLENGTVGQPYSHMFTADGVSAGAVLWTVSSDSVLPKGLTLATNGILSGTTNQAGTYTFMLYAFVSNDLSASRIISLTIQDNPNSAVPILTVSLPDGQVSQDYYAELRAGIDSVTWRLESGDFPKGLTLKTNGLISGVPTKDGVYTFIVRASESNSNRYSTRQFTVNIAKAPAPEGEYKYSGGGGGGCDSGFGVMGLAALVLMIRRHKH